MLEITRIQVERTGVPFSVSWMEERFVVDGLLVPEYFPGKRGTREVIQGSFHGMVTSVLTEMMSSAVITKRHSGRARRMRCVAHTACVVRSLKVTSTPHPVQVTEFHIQASFKPSCRMKACFTFLLSRTNPSSCKPHEVTPLVRACVSRLAHLSLLD